MLGINLISGILQRRWRNDGGEGVVDDERNDADNNQEARWRPKDGFDNIGGRGRSGVPTCMRAYKKEGGAAHIEKERSKERERTAWGINIHEEKRETSY